jgi:hypothetical protein
MGLGNLENNLNSGRLLLLGHHRSHQKLEKGHLRVAFLVISWIFLACICLGCRFFEVQTGLKFVGLPNYNIRSFLGNH